MIATLRARMFDHVNRMSLADFDRWRPGEFMSRFSTDLGLMTDAVSISLPQMVQVTVTFLAALIWMVSIDWLLAVVLLACTPVVSIVDRQFQPAGDDPYAQGARAHCGSGFEPRRGAGKSARRESVPARELRARSFRRSERRVLRRADEGHAAQPDAVAGDRHDRLARDHRDRRDGACARSARAASRRRKPSRSSARWR